MFNPTDFLNQTFDGEFETKRTLIPAGEYTFLIDKVEPKTVGDENKPIFSITLKIVNSGDESLDGRMIWDTVWLDLSPAGNLERGPDKNIRLGQYLEAIGLNGKPWSLGQWQGSIILGVVSQSLDKRSGDEVNRLGRITSAS